MMLFYKTGLEQNGFTVDAFNDPVQAILSFKAGEYDLVILDIKMARMNGFELHKEIQKITVTSRYASSPHSFHTTNL
jgi:DNA-binding response OmpR family regulator